MKWHATHTLSVNHRGPAPEHTTVRIPALRVMRTSSGELFTKHEWNEGVDGDLPEERLLAGSRFHLDDSNSKDGSEGIAPPLIDPSCDVRAYPHVRLFDRQRNLGTLSAGCWSLNPIRERGTGESSKTPLRSVVERITDTRVRGPGGRMYRLIVGFTPGDVLTLRREGQRKAKALAVDFAGVYSYALKAAARKLIADRKAARKAKSAARGAK